VYPERVNGAVPLLFSGSAAHSAYRQQRIPSANGTSATKNLQSFMCSSPKTVGNALRAVVLSGNKHCVDVSCRRSRNDRTRS
jgi:hypothetical protein